MFLKVHILQGGPFRILGLTRVNVLKKAEAKLGVSNVNPGLLAAVESDEFVNGHDS
jgi:hypothetical protein